MIQSMSLISQFAVLVIVAAVLGGADAKPPSRIVGGEDGEIAEFPYQASLRKKNEHRCGGTVISKRHILTAAHCIAAVSNNPAKEMTVVTGTNAVVPGAGVTNTIETTTIHPEYSDKYEDTWKNDIAVITLANDIKFDMFTQSIRLPENDTAPNVNCIASGWGDMSYPNGLEPNNVRKAAMKTVDNERCNREHTKMQILETQLCAFASLGVGLCSGDSGGPLVHDGQVVGVASFVTPCARGKSDVFTRVYSYLDFIEKAMEST